MSRFDQRRAQRLRNADITAGYRDMDAELSLMVAIDTMRERLHVSKEELAQRMRRARSSVSRTLNDENANPTLDTITEMLDALELTAEVQLRPRSSGDEPTIRVARAG